VGEEKSEMMRIEGGCNKQTDETGTNDAFAKHMPGPTPPDLRWNSSTKWRMTHG
jgi:hypothetical protein